MTRHTLVYHPLVAKDSTLAIDLEIMRRTGFEGIEASAAKMRAFLAGGWSRGLPPRSYCPAMLFVSLCLDGF